MFIATRILLTAFVCAAAVGFGGAEASASPREGLYQCIAQDNAPLWYHGVILRFANKGQGLYDILDFGGQRIWGTLWGGGMSYQIDRWNVGWC
ncbi:hypothetical protein [Amycolatopsis decaplanina]|uniref:Uncharacterized protein n=1 Tax=Amycolatopsis decaplanina DSM 44594 TaxID=1284240 RepID=M2YSF8_9PSEU|nr:hypothetical protein [Amycolatopsis decaplanina]EME51718.1 hypothetical protein H074_36084 [Amycolatopsis decaplanina DSM 44594]